MGTRPRILLSSFSFENRNLLFFIFKEIMYSLNFAQPVVLIFILHTYYFTNSLISFSLPHTTFQTKFLYFGRQFKITLNVLKQLTLS